MLQLAVAKNFDSREMAAHQLRLAQQPLVYNCAGLKIAEVIKIHDRVPLVKGRVVKSTLGQSPNERHLPTFESESNAAAGACLLSFMTFAARLSVSRTFAAAEAFDAMPRTRTRPQIMKTHHVGSAFPSLDRIPRTFRISSRRRNARSASIVAFTTLAWLLEPSDFASTSR